MIKRFDPLKKRKNTYQKIKLKDTFLEGFWCLLIDNVSDLEMYHLKHHMPEMINDMKQFYEDKKAGHHTRSVLNCYDVDVFPMMPGIVAGFQRLTTGLFEDQLEMLMKERVLFIRDNLSYTFDYKTDKQYEVLEEKEIESLDYFDHIFCLTERDINITKWDGGVHYYAKVGKYDVTDECGNQKWSSHKIAKEWAIEYLKELQKEEK